MSKIFLASDNTSPVHPSILDFLLKANHHHAPSYGLDEWTEKSSKIISDTFKRSCKVIFVPTGTGANVLSLKLMLRSHHSVICSDIAHIARNETGAAEAIVGCKLLLAKSNQGKVSVDQVFSELKKEKFSGKHATFPAVLSITQPTEVGTIYSLEELTHLRNLCKKEKLLFHIDACRIYNAAACLNIDLHEIIDAAEPDIISLGGTKNGLLAAEAVVIFNQDLQEGSDYLQKQTLQLLSKMRYLSAQYIPFFEDNLWLKLATKANSKAQEMANILKSIPELTINYPVQTNQIFFSAPDNWVPLIQEKIACYVWTQETSEIRFLTSWNTTDDDVEKVRSIFAEIVNISR